MVNIVSSAESVEVKFNNFGKSITYNAKSRGPQDETWGTLELPPWYLTYIPQQQYTAVCHANN